MARTQSIGLRHLLTTLISNKRLWDLARETRFVVRARKVKPPAFFWTLVFGFSLGSDRTLAGLRRAYQTSTRTTLAPSAFYGRFDQSLVRFMKAVVDDLLVQATEEDRALAGTLGSFKEVLATDASVIRLHELLARSFPASRTNHTKAAVKPHAVMNVNGRGAKSFKVTSERTGDGKALLAGKWLKDRLILFDLGYYRYQLFDCIRRNGGFFLSRLKSNTNPTIVAVHRTWPGASVHLVGEKLQDVIARLQREEIDVEIKVKFQRRKYAGKRSYCWVARPVTLLVAHCVAQTGREEAAEVFPPRPLLQAKTWPRACKTSSDPTCWVARPVSGLVVGKLSRQPRPRDQGNGRVPRLDPPASASGLRPGEVTDANGDGQGTRNLNGLRATEAVTRGFRSLLLGTQHNSSP